MSKALKAAAELFMIQHQARSSQQDIQGSETQQPDITNSAVQILCMSVSQAHTPNLFFLSRLLGFYLYLT